ncbi:MAG: HD-GYP domain-containing protein, partial [Lachnospiraceae bacterium]|nr:HD-GYP domain-containing protein [Lachnospiraceae bacterium]
MPEKKSKLSERIQNYVYDPTVSEKNRAFILFSIAVLVALFVAIPCGLIMREPPVATISTLIGALFFTTYVSFEFKRNKIERAKIVLSVIVVFFFLPGMFFTNGGAEGGTPVWLLLGIIYISLILEGKIKRVMMILNAIVIVITWTIGYYYPDLVASYSRGGNYFDSISALFIVSVIIYVLIAFQNNLLRQEEEHKNSKRLFEQTAVALVNAIDAKDKYTHGHSSRVADYSRELARMNGKSESECEEIYYAALLHDVGKIGVPEHIITKEGKLTDEEYAIIKKHSELGSQILQSISEFPYLSIGACGHHERYDGKGYPYGLKGTDIPEIARIISVADAYDAMTSKRSYRDPIPQQIVREEIVKGMGTQFDPDYARLMLHLIDVDTEYEMSEREQVRELAGKNELIVKKYR